MYKYIKTYNLGLEEGIKDAFNDYLYNKLKLLNKKYNKESLSNIYNIGYIDGYNMINKSIKNNLYFKEKV